MIDSFAFLALLKREKGSEKVEEILNRAAQKTIELLISSVNYGEIYYLVSREYGEEKADEIEREMEKVFIRIVDVDKTIAKEAAKFKTYKKMSYADCFVAGLAKVYNAEIITGDKEFKAVEDELKISWIA